MNKQAYITGYMMKVSSVSMPSSLLEVPDTRQTYNYDCGSEVVQAILAYYGKDIIGEEVMKGVKTNKKDGSTIPNIIKYIEDNGLKVEAGELSIEELEKVIKKYPVIVPLQAWIEDGNVENNNDGHYVIAIGSDAKNIYFEDPSSFGVVYLSKDDFIKRWHDKGSDGTEYNQYGIVVIGKHVNKDKVKEMG